MANLTFSGGEAARNLYFSPVVGPEVIEPLAPHAGLISHPLLSPSVQVQILSIVDATGSASIGDIVAELPGHADPVGAIFAMIDVSALRVVTPGLIDIHSVVTRWSTPRDDDHEPASQPEAAPPANVAMATGMPPAGVKQVPTSELSPAVYVGAAESRTVFARVDDLRRPAIYLMLSGKSAYVGYGSQVGRRMADGRQLEEPEVIVAIVDRHNNLSRDEARVAERMFWSMVAQGGEIKLCNALPDCPSIEPDRYEQLHLFLVTAALALRQHGILFESGSTRVLMAGPSAEPERLGPPRPFNDVPEGEVVELNSRGLTALAARQPDDSFLLLRGSDVRVKTSAAATAGMQYLRAAWLYSGILRPTGDGASYLLTRDVVFESGTAAKQFVAGSTGRGHADWVPIDPEPAQLLRA